MAKVRSFPGFQESARIETSGGWHPEAFAFDLHEPTSHRIGRGDDRFAAPLMSREYRTLLYTRERE